jgi:hypothetical protein
MRRRGSPTLIALAVLLAGCASQTTIQLPAIGPIGAARMLPPEGEDPAMTGTLIVYSEELPVSKQRSAPEYPHTGYVIFRANGQVLKKVDNHNASVESEPEEVPLRAGLYEVRARGASVGTVVVPVVIAPGRRTEVFLDAQGMPAEQARALADPVKLADGRVVGARAVSGTSEAPP